MKTLYRAVPQDSLALLRQKAWERLQLHTLPTLPAPTLPSSPSTGTATLCFFEGRFDAHASQLPDSLFITSLEEAMQTHGTLLQHRFSQMLKEETDPFALLNSALHPSGVFLYIPPHQTVHLNLCYMARDPSWSLPRLQLFLGRHAQLTLYTVNQAPSLSTLDCLLEERATLQLYHHGETSEFHTLRASLKRASRLTAFYVTPHCQDSRHSCRIELLEEEAEVELQGLSMPHHSSVQTFVRMEHKAPHCRSRQHVKSLLGPQSRSHFEGHIVVHACAQKTAAYQLHQHFLLDESAHASTQPNLEIFADDVKATHGATVSTFRPEELFYLQARGLSPLEARALLVHAFYNELLSPLPSTPWKENVLSQIRSKTLQNFL